MDNNYNNEYGSGFNDTNYSTPEYNSTNNYGVQKTNTLAIVGFILIFIPLLSLIGWILCIIAFFQIKKTGEKGKGLAIAGILIPIIVVILLVVVAAVFIKVAWPAVKEVLTNAAVCGNGPNITIEEDGNSIICGEDVDGIYSCEFTFEGVTKTITCDMNELQ